jgi:hypothetical protein
MRLQDAIATLNTIIRSVTKTSLLMLCTEVMAMYSINSLNEM